MCIKHDLNFVISNRKSKSKNHVTRQLSGANMYEVTINYKSTFYLD